MVIAQPVHKLRKLADRQMGALASPLAGVVLKMSGKTPSQCSAEDNGPKRLAEADDLAGGDTEERWLADDCAERLNLDDATWNDTGNREDTGTLGEDTRERGEDTGKRGVDTGGVDTGDRWLGDGDDTG